MPSAFAVLRLIVSSIPRRLLNRHIARIFALENASGIDAKLADRVGEAAAIAHQARIHDMGRCRAGKAVAAEGAGHTSLPVYPRLQPRHVRCGTALPPITAATGNSL